MVAHIIYYNYLNHDGSERSIGGIQTYITNLIPVLKDAGFEVAIYQRGSVAFQKEADGATVHGVETDEPVGAVTIERLFQYAKPKIDASTDLLIFGSELMSMPCEGIRSIGIQHGISWDIVTRGKRFDSQFIYQYVRKCYHAWQTIRRVSLTKKLVCVDYNFINWYRALVPYSMVEMVAIPNFAEIPANLPKKNDDGKVRIIFARRFHDYRGTRIFAPAISRILDNYSNVEVTVAGDGPDKVYLHTMLDKYPNVKFITYNSTESLEIHRNIDIALVPTTGSEGTSLSLLEAMASGCAPICTNVGGMTNIVLDHYNGLMISPNENSLYEALCELIENQTLRKEIQKNAYVTTQKSFSLDVWKARWARVIKEVME